MLQHFKRKFLLAGVAILLLIIGIWAIRYYSEDIILFDNKEYKQAYTTEQYTLFTSFYGPDIKLYATDEMKVIDIEDKQYAVRLQIKTENRTTYVVTYPNGQSFLVEDMSGDKSLIAFDENYKIVVMSNLVSLSDDYVTYTELVYYPSNFVSLAYEDYYQNQGYWFIFLVAVALFIFGFLLLKNKSLQMLFFYLSHGLNVVDAEPSDFYFITTKISGAVTMFIAVIIFFMSL